jgi:putative membrane protein
MVFQLLIGMLILAHLGFFVLESLAWEHAPDARADLGFTGDQLEVARVAKNQGLSNAFLAVGLGWGLWSWRKQKPEGRPVLILFLAFIAVAGIVGFVTVNPPAPLAKAAFLVGQTGLAILALVCLRKAQA